jgi:hypothetical protein
MTTYAIGGLESTVGKKSSVPGKSAASNLPLAVQCMRYAAGAEPLLFSATGAGRIITAVMTEPPSPVRTIRLLRRPRADGVGVFCIRVDRELAVYPFREIPCFIGGRGFKIHRWGTRRVYDVRVGAKEDCSCECFGYLYRRRCRHVAGLLTLIRRGKL